MLLHYIKIALRSLWKYRFFSLINIFGLALGIAACILILIHVRSELSYDNFHEAPEEIYRLGSLTQVQDEPVAYPITGYPWAKYLKEIPQVQSSTRIFGGGGGGDVHVKLGDEHFKEEQFFYADSNYQTVFSLNFLSGDSERALRGPKKLILTEATAHKYFGTTEVLGKTLEVEINNQWIDFQVTGVVEAYPKTSHFHFDMLASMSTLIPLFGGPDGPFFQNPGFTVVYTYFRTRALPAVESQIAEMYQARVDEKSKEFLKELFVQPLTQIHLKSNLIAEIEPNGNGTFVYIFIGIALLILLIACINFINLATALAVNRSKEVGMRKVMGALRKNLIPQYLGESFVVAFISLILSLGIVEILRRVLAYSAGIEISWRGFADPVIGLVIIGILLFVGFVAGSYPAFFLTRFEPLQVMSSSKGNKSKGGLLRKALVVFQFVISTALLIGIGVLFKQLNYIETMDMGFEKAHRVVIPVPIQDGERKIRTVEVLKKEFARNPQVIRASASSNIPGNPRAISQVQVQGQARDRVHNPVTLGIDFDYFETMSLELLDGRVLDPEFGTDSTESLLLNEAAVRKLELPTSPIGTEITYLPFLAGNPDAQPEVARVVGIFKDMHFEPIYRDIHPMILRIQPNQYNNLIVNIRPDDPQSTLNQLANTWEKQVPDHPFSYTFLDEDLAKLYESEKQLGSIVSFFTFLAISIACLGIFGLCAFTTTQRRKEISIRKVVGASTGRLVGLISKDFLVLVLMAFPFAAFLAWWGSKSWLDTFAYKTQVGVGVYLIAIVASVAIAFLTISFLSFKAASANPADALYRE